MLKEGVPLGKGDLGCGSELPTCGLVLGEVTLPGEEGIGQYLRSNPASF